MNVSVGQKESRGSERTQRSWGLERLKALATPRRPLVVPEGLRPTLQELAKPLNLSRAYSLPASLPDVVPQLADLPTIQSGEDEFSLGLQVQDPSEVGGPWRLVG